MDDQTQHHSLEAVNGQALSVRRGLSLGAVLAGMVAAIALQLIFIVVGSGIGISMIDPFARITPPGMTFAVSAGVWWIVTSWAALFCGAWLAGKLTNPDPTQHGMALGAVVWTFTTFVVASCLGMAITAIVDGTAIARPALGS